MTSLFHLLIALAALYVGFAFLYVLARRIDNYGIVDIAWSYSFGLMAVFYSFVSEGWLPRRMAIAAIVVGWSVRLGTHLLVRISRHHPAEDTRYVQLRRDWSHHFDAKMFAFFLGQAASVVVLGIGFLVAARNPDPHFHPLEWLGLGLWLVAVIGEAIADAQLAAFKHDPASRGQVCQRGLWHYSRHPNYFFEWLIWVAYFVFALASPWGCLGVVGPGVILFLLLRVTGVPTAEEQSLRSKGDAYRAYQRTTNAFVPWFPKKP